MAIIKMWISMKKKEIEFKRMFFEHGVKFMHEKDGLVKALWELYDSVKDTPVPEMRDQFIVELANLVHEHKEKTDA